VDAEGEHPYAVIYHEYTHFLMSKSADWIPLWLNEGLAEFYENTDIRDKDVEMGEPSRDNLNWLRENRLLPLDTLFRVNNSSPYYHEENKGSIFYAESWALTHYLEIKDFQDKTHHLSDYAAMLAQNVDAVTAASRAFGDLKQLQSNLDGYIRQGRFSYFKMAASTEVDDAAFKVQPLTETQADAVRADFLAYNERGADARVLLERVLQEDPKNVSAHETMGYLGFRAGNLDEARKWYEQAVKLDSQSYLAHYYFAAMSVNSGAGDDAQVESSLRAVIKLNPQFAPAYDTLAVFEAKQHRNLEEAHTMTLTAVQLDPGNAGFRVNAANVLMQMDRGKDALRVLHEAMRVAKNPQETAMIQSLLNQAEEYVNARERQAEEQKAGIQTSTAYTSEENADAEAPEEEVPKGLHHFMSGTLQNVQCHGRGIELTVAAKGKTMTLHRGSYYKIEFSALGFTPNADLSPCKDLEGRLAKVEYIESAGQPAPAYIVAIELHK